MVVSVPVEPTRASDEQPVHVSIVVFPECDPSIVYGVFDTLWAAGRVSTNIKGRREPLFVPRFVAAEAGPMGLITEVSVIPQDTIADVRRTDVVFVPNVMIETAENVRHARPAPDRVDQADARGRRAALRGVWRRARARRGRLARRRAATTHWAYAPLFRELFPDVTLHVERLLVQAGPGHNVVCAGGASSWQDLALLMVAKYGGTDGSDPDVEAVPLSVASRRPAALCVDDAERRSRRRRHPALPAMDRAEL